MKRTASGFTLLELAITMSASGVLLAASIPAVGKLVQSNNLSAAVDQAAAHLRLSRQRAAATGLPHLVVWNDQDASYSIVEDRNANGLADSAEECIGPFQLPESVAVDRDHTELSGDPLRFSPDGSASESGLLAFVSERGTTAALQLIGATGQVKLHR